MKLKHIIFEYYMGITPMNYTLYERKVSDKGKERYNIIGYYGMNLKLLKKQILNIYIFENVINEETDKLLNELDEIINKIEGAFNE